VDFGCTKHSSTHALQLNSVFRCVCVEYKGKGIHTVYRVTAYDNPKFQKEKKKKDFK